MPFWDAETHWPDPWALASAVGAVTTTLRCMSAVYIAPARDLFTVAKSVSTAAVLTNGRVVAGFGAGWCREEFDQTGQAFSGRGRRLAEMIEVLRRLWAGGWVEHHGDWFDFDSVSMAPVPPAPIPITLGGRSEIALRRAARIADGWVGGGSSSTAVPEVIARLHGYLEEAGRDPADFEITIQPPRVAHRRGARRAGPRRPRRHPHPRLGAGPAPTRRWRRRSKPSNASRRR